MYTVPMTSLTLVTRILRAASFTLPLLFIASGLASAQTKIAGDGKCPKPDAPPAMQDVGDRAGHTIALMKFTCTWTNTYEMAGLKAKDYTGTVVDDSTNGKGHSNGYVVITMDNGDKAFVHFTGSGTSSKDGSGTGEGTWSYTGGTGKLRGLTGKGTFKSTSATDGTGTDHIEGDYAVTAPKPPAPKAPAKDKK
jgi:hypothetical protein